MKNILFIVSVLLLFSCNPSESWMYDGNISLNKTTPIGLASAIDGSTWIADGDHNQIIKINNAGSTILTIDSLERPMHIATQGELVLVPEYGMDRITMIEQNIRDTLSLVHKLDAPAGIDFYDDQYAIADFYNHRILFGSGDNWISIGKEGKKDSEFYYPTDVQVTDTKIFVADAYNNRVQVFDTTGEHLLTFGNNEKINAATGIYVSDDEVFVTDFENDRLVIYDHQGQLRQIIIENLDKPTDAIIKDGVLWVTNYRGKSISKFKKSKN